MGEPGERSRERPDVAHGVLARSGEVTMVLAALPAMGLFFVFGGFQGVGAVFYVAAIALVQMPRRAARRKASS